MKLLTIRNTLAVAILVVDAAGMASWIRSHSLLQQAVEKEFHKAGFADAAVSKPRFKKNKAIFEGIKLDQDGFSTIEALTITIDKKSLFTGTPIEEAVISGLIINADIRKSFYPDISGWEEPDIFYFPSFKKLSLNNARLEFMTDAGSIVLDGNAQMTGKFTGERSILLTLKGSQQQMTIDSRWNIRLKAGAPWSASAEIDEMKLDLRNLRIARASGWLAMDGKKNAFPAIDGQLAAGQIKIGADAVLSDVNITSNSTPEGSHIIMQGYPAAGEKMRLTADLKSTEKGIAVAAEIEALSIQEIVSFISDLQAGLRETNDEMDFFTELLITPGNIKRLQKEVDKLRYDTLSLIMTGTLHDLSGKIVAKREKNGIVQKNVVSLDPGE
ncbi:MAG: hypothetical protein HY370_00200 [Proteobacteria bacterium]|nr:hypothetical protein [Pseudomonadota bacterium]